MATDIVLCTFSVIMLLILLFITITSSILMLKGIIAKRIKFSRVAVGSILSLILFSSSSLSYVYYSITQLSAIKVLGAAFYLFGQLSMIFAFIARISFVFKGTHLEISTCKKRLLYCSWFGLILFGVITICISQVSRVLMSIFAVPWVLLYLGTSIVLITIFIRRLRVLALQTTPTIQSASQPSITITPRSTVNKIIDADLLYVAVKNAVLVPVAISSSVIFTLMLIVISLSSTFNVTQLLTIDCTVTSGCIYLLFAFNAPIYNRICSIAHNKCQKWQIGSISVSTGDSQYGMELTLDKTMDKTENIPSFGPPLRLTESSSNPVCPAAICLSIQSHAYAVSNPLMKQHTMNQSTMVFNKLAAQAQARSYTDNPYQKHGQPALITCNSNSL